MVEAHPQSLRSEGGGKERGTEIRLERSNQVPGTEEPCVCRTVDFILMVKGSH